MTGIGSRRDGRALVLMGGMLFVLLSVLVVQSRHSMMDFRTVYTSARCLVEGVDPYSEVEAARVLREYGGERASDTVRDRRIVTRSVYLPTEFTVTAVFGSLPYAVSRWVWVGLTIGVTLLGSLLVYEAAAVYAPGLAGILIAFYLANFETSLPIGNPACLAVGLCVVAVCCLLGNRYGWLGVICLAASLALKPQDAGFVWLYFLLAGGVYRKRSLQTLGVLVVAGLPMVLWVMHVSPQWMRELHGNMGGFFERGGINDPGPASSGGLGVEMMTSLQAVVSRAWDLPLFYNGVSYAIAGALLVVWIRLTLKKTLTMEGSWLGLGAVAELTMLPVYHRLYDAKLVVLAVPGCALLWARRGKLGRWAVGITGMVFLLVADGLWLALYVWIEAMGWLLLGWGGYFVRGVLVSLLPLGLLVSGGFSLWAYGVEQAGGSSEA